MEALDQVYIYRNGSDKLSRLLERAIFSGTDPVSLSRLRSLHDHDRSPAGLAGKSPSAPLPATERHDAREIRVSLRYPASHRSACPHTYESTKHPINENLASPSPTSPFCKKWRRLIRWRNLGARRDATLGCAKCVAGAGRYLTGEGLKHSRTVVRTVGAPRVSRASGKKCQLGRTSVGVRVRVEVQDGAGSRLGGSARQSQYANASPAGIAHSYCTS